MGAIKRQCAIHNLQPTGTFLLKVTQLYEMVVVRHGLMLVGQPFSGKSAALKVLAGALGDLSDAGVTGPLFNRVQQVVINPKAVTMGQLYGKQGTHVPAEFAKHFMCDYAIVAACFDCIWCHLHLAADW